MSITESLIGLLAPPQCVICGREDAALCLACATAEVIPYGECCFDCSVVRSGSRTCEKCSPNAPRHVWITTNYENAARELIKIYKFGHQRAAAESLADLMTETFLDFNSIESLQNLNYLVVPVSTASSRVRQRSFDHSALLASKISRRINLKSKNVLMRIGQTRQVGASRSDRVKQLEGKYIVRNPNLINGQNILLIDDVVTTGATLRAVTKALRKAGAKRIDALVFAKRL